MKNKVVIEKVNDEMKFYLKNDEGKFWLFTQPFSKGVYEWFKDGRAEREILNFDKWKKNKRLVDTVQRIPREIKYVTKHVIPDEIVAWFCLKKYAEFIALK